MRRPTSAPRTIVLACLPVLAAGCGASPELLADLRGHNPHRQIHAVNRVVRDGEGGSEVLDALAALIESPVPPVSVRAAQALGSFGAKAVPHLRPRLEHPDAEVRWKAAMALAGAGPAAAGAADGLAAALGDSVPLVRQFAAAALGNAHVETAIPALRAALKGDEDPQVRWAAGEALRKLGDVEPGVHTPPK